MIIFSFFLSLFAIETFQNCLIVKFLFLISLLGKISPMKKIGLLIGMTNTIEVKV